MKYLGSIWRREDLDHLRTIVVPSGIGEFQWAWTKYLNTGEKFAILGLDGAPRRLHQFCELHPNVEAFGYCSFDYSQIRGFQQHHQLDTWAAVKEKFSPGSIVMLACNPHLEAGLPLSTWLPDLPTTYQYKLDLNDRHAEAADGFLRNSLPEDILIGLSCASYRGATVWNTWGFDAWQEFLNLVQAELPEVRFAMIGGSWDDLSSDVFELNSQFKWLTDDRGNPPIGKLSFGGAASLLHGLDGFIGFSSGLGHVACHCCRTPTFMFWPEHEQLLSRSWVDPALLDSGFYEPSRWLAPKDVFGRVKSWLRFVTDRRKIS